MNNEILARGILAAEEGRQLTDDERRAIKTEIDHAFGEYREGIELTD